MSGDQKFFLIRNYNLWAHISDEEYEELNLVHHFIEAPKGEYVYFDNHNHNKLYFLKGGTIKIGHIDNDGKEVIKEIIREGEVFGQFTLERNNLNGEFAQAYKSDVSLCAFNIDDFEKLLKKKPELAFHFSKQVGQKLHRLQNRLLNLLNKDVKTRLVHFLIMLAQEEGETENNDTYTIHNFLTHEDMAQLIASSRQTVTTMLNELESDGLVTVNRQLIKIHSVKNLQKAVGVF
ncbi:Crp/Fnr family transcriptional regulator [Lacibacter sp. MH-610]|uniref:Crp/Fnr family transcriptional regulator n=1 Tax=Lacibacter sp. MH-610 TaxID=3020883 RepID=UPI003891DAE4